MPLNPPPFPLKWMLLILACLVLLTAVPPILARASSPALAPAPTAGPTPLANVESTREGLVDGSLANYETNRAYLADGSLCVEFLDTPGTDPRPAALGAAVFAGDFGEGAVTYADLWPGITLTFAPRPGATAQAAFTLASGADPGRIRLRYSAPVEVQPDGSLTFLQPGKNANTGAPAAFQTVDGKRVKVPVAYVISGPAANQTVGFLLGAYDPTLPLNITPPEPVRLPVIR